MIKSKNIRETRDLTAKQLKKLRRRYFKIIKPAIEKDHSLIFTLIKKMKDRGLYAKATYERDIMFYVLRSMCWLDGCQRGTNDWYSWLMKNGWGKHPWKEAA